jgi:probable HAF family extracellular repeat protein
MSNAASSINDLGQVVGTSQFTDGTVHSFVWTKETKMHSIGTLPGAFATIAGCCRTINNRGEIVGFSIDANGSTAFLWKDGQIRDLNTLIPSNSPLHLLGASSIVSFVQTKLPGSKIQPPSRRRSCQRLKHSCLSPTRQDL